MYEPELILYLKGIWSNFLNDHTESTIREYLMREHWFDMEDIREITTTKYEDKPNIIKVRVTL